MAPPALECYPEPFLPKLTPEQDQALWDNHREAYNTLAIREELLENWAKTNCDIIKSTANE